MFQRKSPGSDSFRWNLGQGKTLTEYETDVKGRKYRVIRKEMAVAATSGNA